MPQELLLSRLTQTLHENHDVIKPGCKSGSIKQRNETYQHATVGVRILILREL